MKNNCNQIVYQNKYLIIFTIQFQKQKNMIDFYFKIQIQICEYSIYLLVFSIIQSPIFFP